MIPLIKYHFISSKIIKFLEATNKNNFQNNLNLTTNLNIPIMNTQSNLLNTNCILNNLQSNNLSSLNNLANNNYCSYSNYYNSTYPNANYTFSFISNQNFLNQVVSGNYIYQHPSSIPNVSNIPINCTNTFNLNNINNINNYSNNIIINSANFNPSYKIEKKTNEDIQFNNFISDSKRNINYSIKTSEVKYINKAYNTHISKNY